jgi:Dolichyl-phosphate-mannose-protein mannosyltransferase
MKKWGLALAGVLALAALLRIRGLSFGLPAVYNPDEIAIMSRALGFGKGDLNPHNFLYPTLYFYVLFACEGLYFIGGRLLGVIPSRAAFQQSFFVDPTGIYLAGRALGVACGLLTIWATWRFGRRLAGPVAGAAAAVFLAVAPFAVRDAHYVKHDVPATLLITLAVMAALGLAEGAPPERGRRFFLAAGTAGLAMSLHYYAVFVGLPLMFAVWIAWADSSVRERIGLMVRAAAIAAIAFFLGSPFLLAEPLTAWRDIRANRQIVIDRAAEVGGHAFASAPEYARMLWQDAAGWPVILLALTGLVVLARRRAHVCLLMVLFPIAFLIFISTTIAATRYLNPVLPFVALLAGVAIARISELFPPRRAWAAAAILTVAAGIPGFAASWHTGTFFQQTDTRTLALDYFRASVPSGAGVLVQPYSVPLPESRQSLVDALTEHLGDLGKASTKSQLRLQLPTWPEPSYRVIYLGHGGLDADKIYVDYPELGGSAGLSALERRNVQYVVLKRYNDEPAVVGPLVEALGQKARRVAVFSPYRASGAAAPVAPFLHNTDRRIDPALERPGPVLDIWQLQ